VREVFGRLHGTAHTQIKKRPRGQGLGATLPLETGSKEVRNVYSGNEDSRNLRDAGGSKAKTCENMSVSPATVSRWLHRKGHLTSNADSQSPERDTWWMRSQIL